MLPFTCQSMIGFYLPVVNWKEIDEDKRRLSLGKWTSVSIVYLLGEQHHFCLATCSKFG